MRKTTCVALAASLGLALFGSGASARPRPGTEAAAATETVAAAPAQNVMPAPRQISLQQAIQIATSRHPGRVVRAETTTENGRAVHEIRILGADNVVRTVRIDAQGGEPR